MPNHFHLLIRTRSESEILDHIDNLNIKNAQRKRGHPNVRLKPLVKRDAEKFIIKSFSNCFNAYAKYFNIKNDRKGSLFLKNFKRKKVEDELYLKELYFYIHLNPIKHKYRRKPENWRYSSLNNIINKSSDFLSFQYLFQVFKDIEDFRTSLFNRQTGKYPEIDIDDLPSNFKSFSVRF
jgi:REP element-mobilizing transposase RayT